MIGCCGDIGGEKHCPGAEVVIGGLQQPELDGRRDENSPRQAHAKLGLQLLGQPRHPKAPVALAGNENGREPALVAREEALDKLAQGLQIPLHVPKGSLLGGLVFLFLRLGGLGRRIGFFLRTFGVLRLLGQGAAEPRPHRIDKDQIRKQQPTFAVIHQLHWRGRQAAVGPKAEASRPQGSHVQIGRGRPRPAVEDEGERPLSGVNLLPQIGDVEDLGYRLFPPEEGLPAGHRPVGEGLSPGVERVLRGVQDRSGLGFCRHRDTGSTTC
jgi:hypothetical protein